MGPTAKSLILDLVTTLRGGSIPVRALVAAGALFGIGENNIRVSLARLVSAQVLVRDERGSYRLGERAEPVRGRVASWKRLHERVVDWNGAWVGLLPGALARGSAAAKRKSAQARRFLGLRELRSGFLVRPDNLAGGVDGVREQLCALGLEAGASVFGVAHLDAASEARARSLWDEDALASHYEAMIEELAESLERLPELETGEAMTESFLIGGRALRLIALDPLLPDEISPTAPRDELVAAMDGYDRAGRHCWSAFMADFGLPHLRAPLDMRIAADPSEPIHRNATALA